MKRIISLVIVMLLITNMVFANTPKLIASNPVEEYAGFVVTYEDDTLVLEVEGDYITFEDTNGVFNLSTLKAKDHVRLTAFEEEGVKKIEAMTGYSPIMYVEANLFTVEQEGDTFALNFTENPSTGYTWQYKVNDQDHVTYVSDTYETNTTLLGASGERVFTFKVNAQGISTISFKNARSYGDVSDAVDVLVYKTEDQLFVEQDKIVSIVTDQIMDGKVNYDTIGLLLNEKPMTFDVMPMRENNVVMIPLAETLRTLGYEVVWHSDKKSVEISKGAQWTTITIGENTYFKNRMAPVPLSASPILVEGRTMVPAEFFTSILDLGVQVESSNLKITDYGNASYIGYVKEITYDETGMKSFHIVYDLESDQADIIVHSSDAYTFVQKDFEVGDRITAITSMITTRSIPPQTSGYIIY